jgi:hypothetical protein
MLLNEIFANNFRRVNATTRTVITRAALLCIPDVVLTLSWVVWNALHESLTSRTGFACGHPNGQFITILLAMYRCACVVAMLYYWKQLRHCKYLVAEQTRNALKALAIYWYVTLAGIAITAISPVDMARFASYVICFTSTLGLSLFTLFGANLAAAIWPESGREVVEVPSDVTIAVGSSTEQVTTIAVRMALQGCQETLSGRNPDLLVVSYTEQHDQKLILAAVLRKYPQVPVVGSSTCHGVLKQDQFISSKGYSLGIWAISDPEGLYAVAQCSFDSSTTSNPTPSSDHPAFIAGQICIDRAITASNETRPDKTANRTVSGTGEVESIPGFVWISSVPGHEEEIIAGIKSRFSPPVQEEVVIVGGSAADNSVQGKWSVLSSASQAGKGPSGVVAAVCWPSVQVKAAMFSAYAPQARSGTITEAKGRRIISIDGEPAMSVVNRWSAGLHQRAVDAALEGKPQNILREAAMFPLGYHHGYGFDGEPWFQTIHPNDFGPDGSVGCFSNVCKGQEVVQMSTTHDSLLRRVGYAAKHVVGDSHFSLTEVKGALTVFCGGCMLAVKEDMSMACHILNAALGNAPYMGMCCFGEQGPGPNGGTVHGNLMFSAIIFSSQRRVVKYATIAAGAGAPARTPLGSHRASGDVHIRVSPFGALAHLQGDVTPYSRRAHRSSLTQVTSYRKGRVQPWSAAIHSTVPSDSDTQFGDSVLYGMEVDIPMSPICKASGASSQSGEQQGLPQPKKAAREGETATLDHKASSTSCQPIRDPSRFSKPSEVSNMSTVMSGADFAQEGLHQAPAVALAGSHRRDELKLHQRVGSRARSLRRVASDSDILQHSISGLGDE